VSWGLKLEGGEEGDCSTSVSSRPVVFCRQEANQKLLVVDNGFQVEDVLGCR
jgi:hypothetical protein